MNGGWDIFWLGATPLEASHLVSLRISLALYAFLTIALFSLVFPNEVRSLADKVVISGLSAIYIGLAIIAPWMLHADFSMIFWTLAALGLGYVLTKVTITVLKRTTRVAVWYGLSWAAMILGLLTEIGYQADILGVVTRVLNAQTGAMAAALMMGVALADRLKTEREARVAAQSREVVTLRRLRDYFRASPIGLFSADLDGRVTFRNPAFDDICETDQATVAISLSDCLTLDNRSAEILFKGTATSVECLLNNKAIPKWVSVTTLLRNGQLEGQIQDISARRAAEATLTHLANHDSLTGLLNRRGIDSQLNDAIDKHSSSNPTALAQLSVDRFKFVNDLYGHGVGDEVLKEVARRIQSSIRSSDYAGRLGDSFLILLNDCDQENATLLCERLRQFVSNQKFEVRGVTLQLTTSIGVVQLSTGIDSNVAVAAAAHAWTDAKTGGRNKVVHLDATTGAIQDYLAELRLISKLSRIDLSEQLRLEFQPIVDLRGAGRPLCFEVLLRTKNSEDGNPSPFRFIQAAERNGRMSQVDSWVTITALSWIKENLAQLGTLGFCTINISGASINDSKFVENLRGILASYDSILPLICFEITESIALSDLDATKRFVELVKGKGCKLALDDFGAGYTSFSYLKEIPADIIKIDGTFVRDIATNPANLSITKTIVDLTHQLGMQSVAEWAETPECITSLELLGVDFVQGFYLARPMSPDDLLTYAKLENKILTQV
jgi:diguanylate cyclase (GGDEF)-like protein